MEKKEKEKKQRERELLRNELSVIIYTSIIKFKSQFTDIKPNKEDIIHVLSGIINSKTR